MANEAHAFPPRSRPKHHEQMVTTYRSE